MTKPQEFYTGKLIGKELEILDIFFRKRLGMNKNEVRSDASD
ncbi:MAG: hypothetical protein ACKOQ6_00950 [Bacteroidota bacterium]